MLSLCLPSRENSLCRWDMPDRISIWMMWCGARNVQGPHLDVSSNMPSKTDFIKWVPSGLRSHWPLISRTSLPSLSYIKLPEPSSSNLVIGPFPCWMRNHIHKLKYLSIKTLIITSPVFFFFSLKWLLGYKQTNEKMIFPLHTIFFNSLICLIFPNFLSIPLHLYQARSQKELDGTLKLEYFKEGLLPKGLFTDVYVLWNCIFGAVVQGLIWGWLLGPPGLKGWGANQNLEREVMSCWQAWEKHLIQEPRPSWIEFW